MSIATEISRIQSDRNAIREKLVELGTAQPTDGLNALAAAVEEIENHGAVSAAVREGDTYTIPRGYHNGSGKVSGVAGGGNYSLQSKDITPARESQHVTPDSGYYGLADVTVSPIPESYQDVRAVTAKAQDVLAGKIIVDAAGQAVAGTMADNGVLAKTIDGLTAASVTIPAGYTSGGVVSMSDDIEKALAAI